MVLGFAACGPPFPLLQGRRAGRSTDVIKDALKWLTGELGQARDMDVLADEAIVPLMEKAVVPKATEILKRDVIAKRDEGCVRAQRAVTSDRYRQLVLDTVLWINGGRWTKSRGRLVQSRRHIPARRHAAQELSRRLHKVLKKLHKIDDLTPLKRHKLRIAVKKLRYAAGFFESLFGGKKRTKKFSTVLEDLQSSLGQLNDIRVHRQLARTYVVPAKGAQRVAAKAFAMGELSGQERAQSRQLLKATRRRGKRLARCPVFWE